MRADIKLFCGLLLFVAVAQALPAEPRTPESTKLGRVELEKDAEEIPLPDLPNRPDVYDGFLPGISELFERMRQQMLYLMSHVPGIGFGTPDGGNTTSVTKIIDGHKVTINETVYTSGDGEDAAAVFKVRVVDIRPGDSVGDSSASEGPKGSAESLEHSKENEIPNSLKKVHQQKRKVNNMDYLDDDLTNNYNNLETFDNDVEPFDEPDNTGLETFDEVSHNGLETFDEDVDDNKESSDNEIGSFDHERGPVIDLTNDIRINEIAAQNGRAPNPDAEFLPDVEFLPNAEYPPPRDLSRDIYINEIAKNFGRRPNPDAEVFDPSLPYLNNDNNVYDLSRDTYVNEIGNLPINPDAEFVQPFPRSRYYYRTENS